MNDGRACNHYGRKPSNATVCPAHGGRIEEAGALLRLSASYAWRGGLSHWRGGLRAAQAQRPHAAGVSQPRPLGLLQNRRKDPLQTERLANDARRTL